MKTWTTILLLIALVAAGGCGFDKEKGIFMAAGSYGDLAVITSADDLTPVADRFLGAFNVSKTFVIKEEPTFQADVFGPDKWELGQGYKNVLMVVQIGRGGPVEGAARKQVSEAGWEKIVAGGGGVLQARDPWSTYQHLVIVASADRNSLGSILLRNAEKIREIYEESNRERILRRNRYEGLNTALINSWWDRFGFFLEVPAAFTQTQSRPDGFSGVEAMQTGPSRGFTVCWQETADPEGMLRDRDALASLRAEMGDRMHNEDVLPETFVWSEEVLGRVPVVKLEGAWTSNRISGGGAFWCYFIPDRRSGRLFCLDVLVYSPDKDKMPFFRRLAAVASTFTTTRPQP